MRKALLLVLLLTAGLLGYLIWDERLSTSPDEDQPLEVEESIAVEIYFGNSEEDPESLYCDVVYPVGRRIPYTQSPARAALELLLEGPTPEEQSEGYFTSINPGVEIRQLVIKEGRARVDFTSTLDEGVAGSCRVSAIRAQIESTLRQFDSVQDVQILVNGQAEAVLQP